jgi:hypothetical protein
MLGKPKYKQGQLVRFEFDNEIIEGTIEIVDAYGTWADPSDVSYDILGLNDCFYKHVREDYIL